MLTLVFLLLLPIARTQLPQVHDLTWYAQSDAFTSTQMTQNDLQEDLLKANENDRRWAEILHGEHSLSIVNITGCLPVRTPILTCARLWIERERKSAAACGVAGALDRAHTQTIKKSFCVRAKCEWTVEYLGLLAQFSFSDFFFRINQLHLYGFVFSGDNIAHCYITAGKKRTLMFEWHCTGNMDTPWQSFSERRSERALTRDERERERSTFLGHERERERMKKQTSASANLRSFFALFIYQKVGNFCLCWEIFPTIFSQFSQ